VTASGFLLDTNVVSEALRPRPDPQVLAWLQAHETRLWLSVVTIGEIEAGILGAPDPRRAEALRSWLEETLIPQFTHRLLPIDLAVARRWGERTAAARANGTPVGAVDALIAATASEHGLAVATRNGRDFAHLDVAVVDPWTIVGHKEA
jgi:predicted nucleic acid-binding protein